MAIRYSSKPQGEFPLLPTGTFDFVIKSAKSNINRNENPEVIVGFEVADGAHAGTNHTEWMVVTPAAAWRFDQLCDAAGVERIDTGEVDPETKEAITEVDEKDLIGLFVQAEVTHREWQGKNRANLGKFKPSRFSTAPAADAAPKAGAPKATGTPAPAENTGAAPGAGAIAPRRQRARPEAEG